MLNRKTVVYSTNMSMSIRIFESFVPACHVSHFPRISFYWWNSHWLNLVGLSKSIQYQNVPRKHPIFPCITRHCHSFLWWSATKNGSRVYLLLHTRTSFAFHILFSHKQQLLYSSMVVWLCRQQLDGENLRNMFRLLDLRNLPTQSTM